MSEYILQKENKEKTIKPMFGTVSIIEISNPYEPLLSRKSKPSIHGRPIKEYFNKALDAEEFKVMLNGELVEDFDIKLKPNDILIYTPLIQGGDGGGKQIIATIAMVALAIVTYGSSLAASGSFLAAGGISGAIGGTLGMVVGAGIMIAGSMLINSMLAPSVPKLGALPTSSMESPTYSWTGIKTQVTSGNPIPILYGTHKLGGTIIDNSLYYKGREQYLKTLLSLCHGQIYPISSEDVQINNEPLATFLESIEDDESEETNFITLQSRDGSFDQSIMENFGDSSYNNTVNYRLDYDNGSRVFTTQSTNIDNFRVHLRFDNGLYYYTDKGKFDTRENRFKIEYRKVNDTEWKTLKEYRKGITKQYEHKKYDNNTYWSESSKPEELSRTRWDDDGSYTTYYLSRLTGKTRYVTDDEHSIQEEVTVIENTNQPFSYAIEYCQEDYDKATLLEPAQYEIKITPTLDFKETSRQKGIPLVTLIEEINSTDFNHGGEALVGVDIKATEEISGNQPNYTILAKRKPLEITKPNGDVVYKPSDNPAWCCYDLLTNKEYGGGGKILPEDVDYDKFSEWADFCDNVEGERYRTFNIDIQKTANEYLEDGGNRLIGTGYWAINGVIIPLDDLDDELSYTLDDLKTDEGSISFKNSLGNTYTLPSSDIKVIEQERRDYTHLSGYRDVLVINWGNLRYFKEEERPYFGTDPDTDLCDITIDLKFQTQAYNTNPKLRFNGVIDQLGNIWETSQEIAKIGRGQVIQTGTKYSCIFDKPRPLTQIFTDENMRDIEIQYTDINEISTEVEIQYSDKDINYERNQVNIRDNSLFNTQQVPSKSTVQAIGITSQEEALVFGRYLLANNKYIRRMCTGIVDLEALACTVGDVVGVQSSIPLWGVGGVVLESNLTKLSLTNGITTETGKVYTLKIKKKDSDEIIDYIVDNTDGQNSYNDDTIISLETTAEEGDLYTFGEQNSEVVPFRVVSIDRNSDLQRKVSLVEYNESILDFDVNNDSLIRINKPPKPTNEITQVQITEELVKNKTGNAEVQISLGWEATSPNTNYDIYYKHYKSRGFRSGYYNKKFIARGLSTTSLSVVLPELEEQELYRFYIKDNNSSAINSITKKIEGTSRPPEPVKNLTGNSSNGSIKLQWDANTEIDLSHYLVKLNNGEYKKVTETYAIFEELKVQQYTATVNAVDTSGNKSTDNVIIVNVNEPNIKNQIEDAYLIEKAFRDGVMTIFVGIDSDKTSATNYDIWKIPLTSLTVDEYTYASNQLENLSYDDLDGVTYKYYLNGVWYLCSRAQLLVIQRMLTYAVKSALADGALRIFNKQPFPPYDVGDVWIDGDIVRYCKSSKEE